MNGLLNNLGGMAQNMLGPMVGPLKQLGQMGNDLDSVLNVVRFMQRGGNPVEMINRLAASDPQMAQASQMLQGKSPQELQQMAVNMCKELGTTPAAVAQSLGVNIK